MKANYLIAADGVHVYEGGKCVIVGTFDTINSDHFPFVFRPFGIALKVTGDPGEGGKTYNCQLLVRKHDSRKPIFALPLRLPLPSPKAGAPGVGVFVTMTPPIQFASCGKYLLVLKYVDQRMKQRTMCQTPIYVAKVSRRKQSEATGRLPGPDA